MIDENNRSFLYGDGLFETIRVAHFVPLWVELHYKRLRQGIEVLNRGMDWDFSLEDFQQLIQREISKAVGSENGHYRMRLTFYRKQGGLYTPQHTFFDSILKIKPLEGAFYPAPKEVKTFGICPIVQLSTDSLANLKTCSALPYVLAGQYRKQQGWEEVFLLNVYGRLAEAQAANLFIIKDNHVFTPPLTEGPVRGTLRAVCLEKGQKILPILEKKITIEMFEKADGWFSTNAIQGFRWGINNKLRKPFIEKYLSEFHALLIEKAKQYVEHYAF